MSNIGASRKNLTLISFFVIIAALGIVYFFSIKDRTNLSYDPSTPPLRSEQSTKDGCSRTTRLENEPQYDRALSLIHQRIDENNKWWDQHREKHDGRFNYFPADLANCVKIVQQDIGNGIEGYFTFHSEDIKPNYFPITVDKSYYFSDDTLTALLITHEMTHVQQYLDSLNDKDVLSCMEKEVEAFIAQMDFYVTLNDEEIDAVVLRMDEESNNKHPQVTLLKAMTTINRESSCEFLDTECKDKNLRSKLLELIAQDPTYQHQCGL